MQSLHSHSVESAQLFQDRAVRLGVLLSLPVLAIYLALSARVGGPAALLFLVALGVGLVLIFYPVALLYLVGFTLFSGVFWGLGLGGGFLVLTTLAILGLLVVKLFQSDFGLVMDSQLYLLAGFWLFLLMSVLVALFPLYSFSYLFTYVKLSIFYLLVINTFSQRAHVRNVVLIALAAALVSILFGFFELAKSVAASQLSVDSRLRGLTDDPNILALHIVLLSPVVIFLAFHQRVWWKKLALFLIFGLFAAGLVATFSRGGFLSFVFVVAVSLYRRRSWTVVAVTVAILAGLAVFFVPKDFWQHLGKLWNLGEFLQDRSLRERSHLLLGAWQLFKQHFLLGIGIGNFVLVSQRFVLEPLAVHNIFLQVAVETGFFGLVFFVGILVSSYRNFVAAFRWFSARGGRVDAVLFEGLVVGFLGVLVASLFLSTQEYFVLWFLFALSVVAKRVVLQEKEVGLTGELAAESEE